MERTIETGGITFIEPVQGATNEWYYGLDYDHGDLFEAEELFKAGHVVKGRKLCIVHYPDGQVYFPVPKKEGHYSERPVFIDEGIFIIDVDFPNGTIRIVRFDCKSCTIGVHAEIPLSDVKDCYNLHLYIAPLTLTRQCVADNEFEIIWPEKVSFRMDDHDSFFLRDGDRLYFNRWHEEGEGAYYKYSEETIVRDLSGNDIETLPGDVMLMPNGEIWNLK